MYSMFRIPIWYVEEHRIWWKLGEQQEEVLLHPARSLWIGSEKTKSLFGCFDGNR